MPLFDSPGYKLKELARPNLSPDKRLPKACD